MQQIEFNETFRVRSKKLALSVIQKTSGLSYTDALSVIRKQLIRSSTSVAANFRAVTRARSQKEQYSKLCIVVEEADETLFWLDLLVEGKFLSPTEAEPVYQEALEILKVMATFKKRVSPPKQ